MKTSTSRRVMSALLSLVMVISLLPMSVLAAALPASAAPADHLVISQAYGGGGNSGAKYKNDFVELYNPTKQDVDLTGWSVRYGSKKAVSAAELSQITELTGAIKAGGHYLIQMAAGSGGTLDLPTPDLMGRTAMSGKDFVVGLFSGETQVDLLGVGDAQFFETAPAAKLSNKTAAVRKDLTVDTDNNSADFVAAAPAPHSSTAGPAPERQSGVITDLADLRDGDKVVVFNPANNKALSSVYQGFYNTAVDVTLTDGKLTGNTPAEVWTLGVAADGSYTFATADGKKLSMDADHSSLPLDKVNPGWAITAAKTSGCFYIQNTARKSFVQYTTKFGTWSASAAVKEADEALFAQQLYLIVPDEKPEPEKPAAKAVPIADALAGAKDAEFTVKGVVTMVDGQNIYTQDATGGICVRLQKYSSDIALGDTIVATGKRSEYKGMPQLSGSTFEKSTGVALSAKSVTIGALTTKDLCTYVKLAGAEVTAITENVDKNGSFNGFSLTLADATGSIQVYKAPLAKTAEGLCPFKVGDKVDITAAVGCYNSNLQLRVCQADQIKPAGPQVKYDTIADALAGAKDAEFTVKGVVTIFHLFLLPLFLHRC